MPQQYIKSIDYNRKANAVSINNSELPLTMSVPLPPSHDDSPPSSPPP